MQKFDTDKLSKDHLYSLHNSYVPKYLNTCNYVRLRTERVQKPMKAPYIHPFQVLHCNPKYFTMNISGEVNNTVSIDRLKATLILKLRLLEILSNLNQNQTTLLQIPKDLIQAKIQY